MQIHFSEKQRKIVAIAAFLAVLAVMAGIFWYVGRPMLQFVSEPEQFRLWVDSHGVWGRVLFLGMVILQVVIAFIPGEPLESGAGYAFGFWEGTLLCLLGIILGSVLVFLLVRTLGIRFVEVFFSREKILSLRFLKNKRRRNFWIFFILMIPGTPKDLLSYFVGLTNIKLFHWILITSVARIPSIITSTIGGNALGVSNYFFALLVFLITMTISGIGILIYHIICKRCQKKK